MEAWPWLEEDAGGRQARGEVTGGGGTKGSVGSEPLLPGESQATHRAVTGAHAAGTQQLQRWLRSFRSMCNTGTEPALRSVSQTRDTAGGEEIHEGSYSAMSP